MAERFFDVFATTVDGLLSAQPARQGYASGDAWFAGAPKELRGSLLSAQQGKEFNGGGKFAMIRTHSGFVHEAGVDKLRVSVSGGQAGSTLMSRAELGEVCGAVVVGVMADNSNTSGRAGMWADKVGGSGGNVRLMAVESDQGFTQIRATSLVFGVVMETVLSVEEAVLKFNLQWRPWQQVAGEQVVPQQPAYSAPMEDARQAAAQAAVRVPGQAEESAARAAILQGLGLVVGGGRVQVGEMCALAVALVGRPVADGARLLGRMGSATNQRELAEAVYGLVKNLQRLQADIVDKVGRAVPRR